MSNHDLSPTAIEPKAAAESHCVSDDFDMLQIDEEVAKDGWDVQSADSATLSANSRWIWRAVFAFSLAATFFWFQSGNTEQKHENWKHVAAASDASTEFAQQLTHVDSQGNAQILRSIRVSDADRSSATTQQAQSIFSRNTPSSAMPALNSAQDLQRVAKAAVMNPAIGLAAALRGDRPELFEIELFDCCDEDGDVVEILVNGAPLSTVPLTHGGSVLAIPLTRGQNSITVLATHDGGGGVTVSLRTSHGEYFARHMDEGESHQMGAVVQ